MSVASGEDYLRFIEELPDAETGGSWRSRQSLSNIPDHAGPSGRPNEYQAMSISVHSTSSTTV
jgi:hypothetical protein